MDKPTVIPVTPPPDEIEMEDPQTGEKRKYFPYPRNWPLFQCIHFFMRLDLSAK